MIYRLCYLRKNIPVSITFFAGDLERVAWFSDLWERLTKCPVLTVKPEGLSKFPAKPYRRHHERCSL